MFVFFFFQAEDGIRDKLVTGVQTCALPIFIDDEKSDRNGTLLDADIELNALDFKIAVDHQSLGPAQLCESDLANTFTHEIGHLMGLDHTCWNGSDARLNDDLGDPLPLCSMSAGQ